MQTKPTRREMIRAGFAGAGVIAIERFTPMLLAAEDSEGTTIPFIDPQPIDPKRPMLKWEDLRDWVTPMKEFFAVSHYGEARVDESSWRLRVEGAVSKPLELSLDQLRARPKKEITATLECSGNGAGAGFMGAIGNARWAGTPLAEVLGEAGVGPEAVEVAFWGADSGKEKIRNKEYQQNFARSLSLEHANKGDVLLAWEMNGKPLSPNHGFPLRLIVPGWYGIAWVKWLSRIEVRNRRLMNRFMARDYVTIRGKRHGNTIEWTETSVGPLNVKSLVGRVSRARDGTVKVTGAAWSDTPVVRVDLRIDEGPWKEVRLEPRADQPYAWTFWSYEWKDPMPGEHTLVSRAEDASGRVQPAADDDVIKLKQTYWEANQQYPRRIRI